MSRNAHLYLQDILLACGEIDEFIRGLSFEEFKLDKLRVAATSRNLEVIGEASQRLPPEVRSAIPNIPWEKIIGMRNILAHAYFNVDRFVVWTVATQRIPELMNALNMYMQNQQLS